jgi:hypothetical protein
MAADRPYGEFYDFYSVSPEYFGYHIVRIDSDNFNSDPQTTFIQEKVE